MSLRIEGQALLFHFETEQDLAPESYAEALDQVLLPLSRKGKVGLLATFGDAVRVVPPRLVSFWLMRVRGPEVQLKSIVIVTTRLSLRIAVQGFAQAARTFSDIEAIHLPDVAQAREWLRARVDMGPPP